MKTVGDTYNGDTVLLINMNNKNIIYPGTMNFYITYYINHIINIYNIS